MNDAAQRFLTRMACSIVVLIVSGCSRDTSPRSDAESERADLAGIPWTLEMLGTDAVLAEFEVTLTFAEDSTFGGSAGCNRYFGQYSIAAADSIRLGETGSTRMMCTSSSMEQEGRYLGTLSRVTSYQATNDILQLFEDSLLSLEFVRGVEPEE